MCVVNPFDKNFFNFLLGFLFILCFSFSILYFTGKYSDVIDGKDVAASAESLKQGL
jgi:hypothetical protein